jgi:hypothetical protein
MALPFARGGIDFAETKMALDQTSNILPDLPRESSS